MPKCDFCEEEDGNAAFDPDWDAVTCDKCEAVLEAQKKYYTKHGTLEGFNE